MPSTESRRSAAAKDLARAGGRDAEVKIVAYDPAWPAALETERERLAPLLNGVEIHHFGSTAVPSLAAKPVIDMIALVPDLDASIGVPQTYVVPTSRAGSNLARAWSQSL